MYRPVVIRSIGRLVAITPLQYNLEYSCQLFNPPGADYTHSIHGIMKSCVTKIHDFGPGPDKE